jgi:hypothetical protein
MVKLDRRRNRLALPGCPECAGEEPRVLMRTNFVLYVRCGACRAVWSVWKP